MVIAIVSLFVYRHYCVLPPSIKIKLRKSIYFSYWSVVYLVFMGTYVRFALGVPEKQFEAQTMNCRPPRIFTPCALVVDTSYAYAWFIVIGAVIFGGHVIFFTAHSIYILSDPQIIMSQKTRKIQKSFLYSLCIQVFVPLMFLLIPFSTIAVLVYTGRVVPCDFLLFLQLLKNPLTRRYC
ncbi:unnamed protein product [Caenorhabditis auriculariae]|uniref:Uncharacterized protein n=1 Tax=Caenorhabditis auriculariae TaxID=2777116 RepID=A0A8S1H356_9PELO|nr:unnamed protein product [Caenorhabditis auriculariae]